MLQIHVLKTDESVSQHRTIHNTGRFTSASTTFLHKNPSHVRTEVAKKHSGNDDQHTKTSLVRFITGIEHEQGLPKSFDSPVPILAVVPRH